MAEKTDISETAMLLQYGEKVVKNMLKDHTTQQNIYWATNSYVDRGEGFGFFDPITIDKITNDNEGLIRPRAQKSLDEQITRIRDKAEVFTPSWICNSQNNLIDEAWFGDGRKNIFNEEKVDSEGNHYWINNPDKIDFSNVREGKDWKDYVADVRMEITCGEAPYLVNRYDAVSGEYQTETRFRIGLLDRKLRVVTENVRNTTEWLLWAKIALRATYGFEWQGDSLLLAREGLFYSFLEHFSDAFPDKKMNKRSIPGAAYIISWNIWQMDGLTFGLPGYKPEEQLNTLFPDEINPKGIYCRIKDFLGNVDIHNPKLQQRYFADLHAEKNVFKKIVEAADNVINI